MHDASILTPPLPFPAELARALHTHTISATTLSSPAAALPRLPGSSLERLAVAQQLAAWQTLATRSSTTLLSIHTLTGNKHTHTHTHRVNNGQFTFLPASTITLGEREWYKDKVTSEREELTQ